MMDNVCILKLEDGDKRMVISTKSDEVQVTLGGNDFNLYYVYDNNHSIRVIKDNINIVDKVVKLDGYHFHCHQGNYYDENDEYQVEFTFFIDKKYKGD